MSDDFRELSVEVIQQRLVQETEAQQRLQDELRDALESEKRLRLENDVLKAHLEQSYPGRVEDARELYEQLLQSGDLLEGLQQNATSSAKKPRTIRQKIRRGLGSLPGVHRVYHSLKNKRM